MKIGFIINGNKDAERDLAAAFGQGVREGVYLVKNYASLGEYDLVCMVGVKSVDALRALPASKPWLYFDKGYNRDWPRWWRVAYGSNQPRLEDLPDLPADRARSQGWLSPGTWRTPRSSDVVLIAGSSEKYHNFAAAEASYYARSEGSPELPRSMQHPTRFARGVVQDLRTFGVDRRVVYRPKRSWKGATPIAGADYSRSRASIEDDLRRTAVLVTMGSAASIDALLAGVPSVCLGGAPIRSISSTTLMEAGEPRLATEEERVRTLSQLAYFQWNLDEIREGRLWAFVQLIM